ncbi:rolling circle replication-associated protein [Dyella sp.]|uniref:rolling circle replication-associated protein n=1 Tax=Dyella sp. TaxID=1869338 RepID=UPI003F8193E4
MKTGVGHAARLIHFDAHCERHAQRWNLKFITLTYHDEKAWRPGHFSKFRDALRQWCKRRQVKCRFVWVAELQKRGALHYHVILWLPKGKFLPFADSQGWWPHGHTNVKTAQSAVGYITKYASKTTAGQAAMYPRGARMFGHGGLTPEARRHVRYWQAPFWVRDALTGRADIRKVVGGYCDKLTGEFFASPWRVSVGPGGEVWAYRIDDNQGENP